MRTYLAIYLACARAYAHGGNFEATKLMDSEVEDSDATVAPDIDQPMSDNEDCNEEAAGEKSPSFLDTQAIELNGRVEYSQSMSPELPLASATGTTMSCTKISTPNVLRQVTGVSTEHQVSSVVASSNEDSNADSQNIIIVVDGSSDTISQSMMANNDGGDRGSGIESQCMVGSSEPETTTGLELDDIIRQQTELLHSLQQTASMTHSNHPITCTVKSSEELKKLRAKATELESSMKEISIANQRERKRLAIKHSSLSQQSHSQHSVTTSDCVIERNESLRRQLMSLASKQKTLLQCFKTQKDLVGKLERETNLQAQGRIEKDETSQCIPGTERSRGTRQTTAAIPNLVQHLKPQQVSKNVQPQKQQPLLSQHPLPIFNAKTVNTEQPPPPTTSITITTSSSRNTSHVELAVPVPLLTLIQHQFIEPDNNCLSLVLMGCEFKCSLMKDGSLCTLAGVNYKTPNLWVHSCWLQLGQHKHSIKTKFAFKNVMYRGIPLINICEQFNKKQVSTYQQMKKGVTGISYAESVEQGPMNAVTGHIPGKTPLSGVSSELVVPWNESDILMAGQVLLVDVDSVESLDLPAEFWKANNVLYSPQLVKQLENDFDW